MWLAMMGVALAQININTATKEQLSGLKGVGPAKAEAIVDYRTKNGPFKTVDDLEKVKGIGPATMKDIRGDITVAAGKGADKADAKKDAKAEKADAKKDVKGDKADAKKDAKADKSDAKKDVKADKADAKKDAKADKADAKKDAKADKADAKKDAKADKSDAKKDVKADKADAKKDAKAATDAKAAADAKAATDAKLAKDAKEAKDAKAGTLAPEAQQKSCLTRINQAIAAPTFAEKEASPLTRWLASNPDCKDTNLGRVIRNCDVGGAGQVVGRSQTYCVQYYFKYNQ